MVADSTIHLFIGCLIARLLWFNSPVPIQVDKVLVQNRLELVDWILCKCECDNKEKFMSTTTCVLDQIWKMQNASLFRGKDVDPCRLVMAVWDEFIEFSKVGKGSD